MASPMGKINDDVNDNENYHPEGKHREAQSSSTLSSSLESLMECKAPDGRYLMRHRYQWWAVYHVLVRQCGFPDGYREFVACIAQLFPEGLRVPCTESTMKQLSQTRYMEPVSDWRYDALYHGSPERFRLMRETVEWMGEMVEVLQSCLGAVEHV